MDYFINTVNYHKDYIAECIAFGLDEAFKALNDHVYKKQLVDFIGSDKDGSRQISAALSGARHIAWFEALRSIYRETYLFDPWFGTKSDLTVCSTLCESKGNARINKSRYGTQWSSGTKKEYHRDKWCYLLTRELYHVTENFSGLYKVHLVVAHITGDRFKPGKSGGSNVTNLKWSSLTDDDIIISHEYTMLGR